MQTVTTIGLDIAKSVFQVHGTDATGQVVIRRQLKHRFVLSFFEKLPPGPEREALLRKARQDEIGAHMTEWLTSPGLRPPT